MTALLAISDLLKSWFPVVRGAEKTAWGKFSSVGTVLDILRPALKPLYSSAA